MLTASPRAHSKLSKHYLHYSIRSLTIENNLTNAFNHFNIMNSKNSPSLLMYLVKQSEFFEIKIKQRPLFHLFVMCKFGG